MLILEAGIRVRISLFLVFLLGYGILSSGGTLTLSNRTLVSNSATRYGGGIINDHGTVTVINSTLASNSAYDSGGILSVGTVAVRNALVAGNTALDQQGPDLSADRSCSFSAQHRTSRSSWDGRGERTLATRGTRRLAVSRRGQGGVRRESIGRVLSTSASVTAR
jgi:hypothetical protein